MRTGRVAVGCAPARSRRKSPHKAPSSIRTESGGRGPRREVGREDDQLHAGLAARQMHFVWGWWRLLRSEAWPRSGTKLDGRGLSPVPLVMAVRETELPDVAPRANRRRPCVTIVVGSGGFARCDPVSTTQIEIQTQTPGSSPPCLSPKSSQQPTTNREPDTEPGRLAQCEAVAGVGDDDFEDVVLDIAFAPDESLAIRIGVNHALATASVTAGPIRASTLGATPWTAAKSRTRCLMNGAAAGRASSRRLRDGTFWLRDRRLRWFAPRELLRHPGGPPFPAASRKTACLSQLHIRVALLCGGSGSVLARLAVKSQDVV